MAKNNQSLAHRAASIKPEYSPLEAPPNPNEDEARAAIREYAAQMGLLANPPKQQRPPLTVQPDAVLVGECMVWDDDSQAVVTINQPDAVTHVYHCAGFNASRDALGENSNAKL